jgi:hypothetical protein
MEIFACRSVSYAKDLGGRRWQGPIAFGSRCEVFEKTTNTLADRTRPAIWLGSKSNAYGSGLFFLLDTERVVARDHWKSMPMDVGTINLLNRVAQMGPALPKNLAIIYKGSEVEDINLEGVESSIENENTKIIQDLGASMPFPIDIAEVQLPADYYDPIEPDEEFLVSPDPLQQLEPELSGAEYDRGEENSAVETLSERMPAATSVQENGSEPPVGNRQVPEAPSHLAGEPLVSKLDGRRPVRLRREPDRYKPSAFLGNIRRYNEGWATTVGLPPQSYPTMDGNCPTHQHVGYTMSVENAIKTLGEKAITSMTKELWTLHEKGVFKAVDPCSLSDLQRRSIIRSSMFLKEKFLSTAELTKGEICCGRKHAG